MGIDTDYRLVLRSEEPLALPIEFAPNSVPEKDGKRLLQQLAPVGGSEKAAIAKLYAKNGSPSDDVIPTLDACARGLLRGPAARLLLVSSIDSELSYAEWRIVEDQLYSREGQVDPSSLRATFVPEEPALCAMLVSSRLGDLPSLRLPKSLPPDFSKGLHASLSGSGLFFWDAPLGEGLHGTAVALQKAYFSNLEDSEELAFLIYQTAIEGCFAWVCTPGSEWPKHARMPFSLADAPGDLLR